MYIYSDTATDHEKYFKAYEAIWRNMERENSLIAMRNQWAIVLSGGFLATEGILLNALVDENSVTSPLAKALILVTMLVLSAMAIFFCNRSRTGVEAAQAQLEDLKTHYYKFGAPGENIFEEKLHLPRPFGQPRDHLTGNSAAATFPTIMLLVWWLFAILQLGGAAIFFAFARLGIGG